jgi:HEAT repeat protein
MKKEYRIQNTEHNCMGFQFMQLQNGHMYCKKQNVVHCWILCFVSIAFGLALIGCGQKIHNPNQGMNQTQIDAFRIISESLSSDNPIVRVNAIEAAATTKQQNYLPVIQKLLQDRYVPVRFAACIAIGEMQYTPAIDNVNQLLRDSDPNVIIAASFAMSKLGYPEYIKVLRESVVGNGNQTIKANSALLLGKSDDKSSIQLLYQLMKDPKSSDMVAYQAAEALAMLSDNNIYQTLWGMLISAYADVRITGVNAMGNLKTTQAENALLTMLSDPITEIRLAAAEQLGKFNNKSGQNVVLEVFQKNLNINSDIQSRERINTLAALAIGEIGTPNLTKFLPDLMKNESPFVRLAAAKAVFQSYRNL